MGERSYVAIDLKSFYASVECVSRGLDPLKTHLVVADVSRTEKTICLAVSPPLKAQGVSGRPRLFEVVQKVQEVNARRRMAAPGHAFTGKTSNDDELRASPAIALDYVVARPRMAEYMAVSTAIYRIYLRYIAPEDIHVYSIDEVFMDVTDYLATYACTAGELTMRMIHDVYSETGITATAGIGTNLYLAKVAMDIVAKHQQPDANGVRIAQLDEMSYRRELWTHRPLTDFWRLGHGYARKLEQNGLYTMGDIARCSMANGESYGQARLYKLFGVNAELLIDHAWGYESCTMRDIKTYRPQGSSVGSGQVLSCGRTFEQARLVVREMADALALELLAKGLKAEQLVLNVGYDRESLEEDGDYAGETEQDRYGRVVPKGTHGARRLMPPTASARLLRQTAMEIYDQVVNRCLLVRRVYVVAGNVKNEREETCRQMDLFSMDVQPMQDEEALAREERVQQATIAIKERFGKNAILRGMDLQEGATTRERNRQIGGHKA